MADHSVLEQMEEFVAMCAAVTTNAMKHQQNVQSIEIKKVHIDGKGNINCEVNVQPHNVVKKLEMKFNVNDIFIQDGVMRLPDGSGLYTRSSALVKIDTKKKGR